ncbi:synaptobrevin YKT6 [Pelomyxa schiedti]|nr:synaptobrevin YKT6 [Pelomyxa schiedti]
MKLIGVLVFRQLGSTPTAAGGPGGGGTAILLASAFQLASFGYFERGSVKEICTFGCREVASRAGPGQREIVKLNDGSYLCHVYTHIDKISVTVVTDGEYQSRVAFTLLGHVLDEFRRLHSTTAMTATHDMELPFPALPELLARYEDPVKADPISKVEMDLEETKNVMIKNIDQLLERDESLARLVEKSDDLSWQSRVFVNNASAMNKCCNIL